MRDLRELNERSFSSLYSVFFICISGFYLEDNLYQNRMAKGQVVVNVAKLIPTLKNAKRHLESTTELIDSLNLKAEEISRKNEPSQTRLNPQRAGK
jgi:hypothetical protein